MHMDPTWSLRPRPPRAGCASEPRRRGGALWRPRRTRRQLRQGSPVDGGLKWSVEPRGAYHMCIYIYGYIYIYIDMCIVYPWLINV